MHVGGRSADRALAAALATLAVALIVTCALAGLPGPPLGVTPAAAAAEAPVAPVAAAPARHQSAIDPDLEAKLVDRLSHATSGRYGMVVDIDGVGRVASLSPASALRPASTQKLFTTLPLLLSRPDDTLVTDVTTTADPVAGVVSGDLVIHASDDPSLNKADLASLAHQVGAAGITKVTGDLVLDIGSLPTNTRQPGWKYDFVPTDIGPLSPFPVHRDDWRRDSSYLAHPTNANLDVFRTRLAQHGVKVDGPDVVRRSTHTGTVVATHESQPLSTLITETLRQSDNFYAESLLAVAGGHKAVNAVSTSAGVTDTSYSTDGSGLSYDDRQTARGEVTLLGYAHQSAAADDLLQALPLGCRRGTLKDRFCHTIGAGMVYAKTGTLSRTSALAGYTTDAAGRWVTFSVICGKVRSVTAAMHAIDHAVLVLRRYSG
jgi:D-alanyl-D-alanine carboxypeptidase/D-alanyl-D-alanine-endopeptidase (penicillin-binding protein 4)